MAISSDQFKLEQTICDLTENECEGFDCRECEISIEGRLELEERRINEEQICFNVFERKSRISDREVLVNSRSTIAKTDIPTLNALQEQGIIPKAKIPYHPDFLKEHPLHRKLRSYNKLGIPDELFAAKGKPAAFRFGDVVYLIAPRIEPED